MTQEIMWSLLVAFAAIAIGTSLKMAEALHGKKLTDDECARLRIQLDVLNKPKDEKAIDVQLVNADKTPVLQAERMEKIKEDILVLLSIHPDTPAEFFAQSTKVGNQVALHHLEAMQEKNLVSYYWRTKEWKLQPMGREYLVHHSLIS